MDPVAELSAEYVVDELVLGDPREAGEGRPLDHGLEMGAVAADCGTGSWNTRFDAVPQLVRGNWHIRSVASERTKLY